MPPPLPFSLARMLLAPLLLWQGRQVRRRTVRLPEAAGARLGLAGIGQGGSAMPRLRLLIVGDSSGAGVGAATQDEALAGRLGQALARLLHAPVAWQLVAQSGWTTPQATEALATLAGQGRLPPADVLVTALGVNDAIAMTSPARWLRQLDALERQARELAGVRHLVLTAVPPLEHAAGLPQPLRAMLGRSARRLDDGLRQWAAGSGARLHVEPPFDPATERAADLLAADGFHPGPALYRRWAEALAAQIAADWPVTPALDQPAVAAGAGAGAGVTGGSGRGRPSRSIAT